MPQDPRWDAAVSTTELISALCRGAWDQTRTEAYALTLLSADVPIQRLAQTARWLLTQIEPDDITPARLVAEAKRYVPQSHAMLASDEVAASIAVRPGYGQPTSWKEHPGIGTGSQVPVVLPNRAERRRLNAFYLRRATETAPILLRARVKANERRAHKGDPAFAGDMVAPLITSLMRRWLREGARHCEWCRARLTEQTLKPYIEWTRELGQIRPLGTPMPEAKVFCADCAAGAISELVDAIPYVADVTPF